MRMLILMACLSALMFIPNKPVKAQFFGLPTTSFKVTTKVKIIIARPKKNCETGLWVCVIRVVVDGELTIKGGTASREVEAELIRTDRDDGFLVKFLSDLPVDQAQDQALYMEGDPSEAYEFSPDLLEAMELSYARIDPGKYEIKTSEDGFKYVWLSAQME